MANVKQPELRIRQYVPQDQQGVNAVFINGSEFYRDSFPDRVQMHWTDFIQESIDGDLARIPNVYIAPGGNFWVVTTADEECSAKPSGCRVSRPNLQALGSADDQRHDVGNSTSQTCGVVHPRCRPELREPPYLPLHSALIEVSLPKSYLGV